MSEPDKEVTAVVNVLSTSRILQSSSLPVNDLLENFQKKNKASLQELGDWLMFISSYTDLIDSFGPFDFKMACVIIKSKIDMSW